MLTHQNIKKEFIYERTKPNQHRNSQNTVDAVIQKLNECKVALEPYLQALTNDQRISLFKQGDKTLATVQKIKAYIDTNPEFVPTYMDKEEFLKDEAVASQLSDIANIADQLATNINDTVMLAGSEALQAAMFYYGQVKEARNKGIPSARPIYDDLSQRFAKKTPPPPEK